MMGVVFLFSPIVGSVCELKPVTITATDDNNDAMMLIFIYLSVEVSYALRQTGDTFRLTSTLNPINNQQPQLGGHALQEMTEVGL
mmetsp:Transcript_31713/g.64081  ORF Transcript_31713/g.64081 Transcript_31713/m.64081 type:complete len:85 (-) Transcript_31713:57-311(-)